MYTSINEYFNWYFTVDWICLDLLCFTGTIWDDPDFMGNSTKSNIMQQLLFWVFQQRDSIEYYVKYTIYTIIIVTDAQNEDLVHVKRIYY